MKKTRYKIVWGAGFSQVVTSKSAALKIISELVENYETVQLTKIQS